MFRFFGADFYKRAQACLCAGGIYVQQSESPLVNQDIIRPMYDDLAGVFGHTLWMYLSHVMTYPGAMWSFAYASRDHHPLVGSEVSTRYPGIEEHLSWYTPSAHAAAFGLPRMVRDLLPAHIHPMGDRG